jgi:hypothetical protein
MTIQPKAIALQSVSSAHYVVMDVMKVTGTNNTTVYLNC